MLLLLQTNYYIYIYFIMVRHQKRHFLLLFYYFNEEITELDLAKTTLYKERKKNIDVPLGVTIAPKVELKLQLQ